MMPIITASIPFAWVCSCFASAAKQLRVPIIGRYCYSKRARCLALHHSCAYDGRCDAVFLRRGAVLVLLPQAPPASTPSQRKRVVFVVGGPGSGKGTQVRRGCGAHAPLGTHVGSLHKGNSCSPWGTLQLTIWPRRQGRSCCLALCCLYPQWDMHPQSQRCSSTVRPCRALLPHVFSLPKQTPTMKRSCTLRMRGV